MPVIIPSTLPAYSIMEDENIFVMSSERAQTQDIRPLEIVLVNLMPTKIETETRVSVSIFVGMRLTSTISSGLMSWVCALSLLMTNIFSSSIIEYAGSVDGIITGILLSSQL